MDKIDKKYQEALHTSQIINQFFIAIRQAKDDLIAEVTAQSSPPPPELVHIQKEIDKLSLKIEALYELQRPQHAGFYLSCSNPDCDSRIKIHFTQRNSTVHEITDLYCPNCGTLNEVV